MHDVAPKQGVEASAIDPFGRNGPGGRKLFADRGLPFFGQQQAAQAAVGIGECRGDGVVAV
jgi:hypothetical protein